MSDRITYHDGLTSAQTIQAIDNWMSFFKDCPNESYRVHDRSWQMLEHFVGHRVRRGEPLPEKHFNRFLLLLSPHYKTILAAYCVTKNIRWK